MMEKYWNIFTANIHHACYSDVDVGSRLTLKKKKKKIVEYTENSLRDEKVENYDRTTASRVRKSFL